MSNEIITYLDRVIGGIEKTSMWATITTYANEGMAVMKNFFTVLVPDEVAALTPFAEQALAEAADALPTLFAGLVAGGGNLGVGLGAYAAAVAPVIIATAQKAEAAGLAVAGAAVSTAVHAAIANSAAAQAAPVGAVNPTLQAGS